MRTECHQSRIDAHCNFQAGKLAQDTLEIGQSAARAERDTDAGFCTLALLGVSHFRKNCAQVTSVKRG